jgi:copper chaperone
VSNVLHLPPKSSQTASSIAILFLIGVFMMHIQLHVPSIVCKNCADKVAQAIVNTDPKAAVKIDLETKQVEAETQTTELALKAAIAAIGHTVN